jgi:hypothetical protein
MHNFNSAFAKRLGVRRISGHTMSLEVSVSKTDSNVVSSQQRRLSKENIYPFPASNAEIKQTYFLVACVTREKERAEETEDTACTCPSYAGHLPHYTLKAAQPGRHY